MMITQLRLLESGVALLLLGSPEERAITLTQQRLHSFRDNLNELKKRPPLGLIVTGPSLEMFSVGADINVIGSIKDAAQGAAMAAEGQAIYDELAALPFPTVAAISGPCVGGGCEMVLACGYRIISDNPSSSIGLPEVKIGILPGFGGTQRLPRLIGLPKALDIILAGKTLKPKQAVKVGLVNEVCPAGTLLRHAEEILIGSAKRRPVKISLPDRLLSSSLGRWIVKRNAEAALKKQTKGFYPAPPAALKACLYGLEKGMSAGLKYEAEELGKLAVTSECASLIKIYFLTEKSKALGKSARKSIEQLQTVVIGAGVMGAGIAGSFAKNGCGVILKDTQDAALQRGLSQIRDQVAGMRYLSDQDRSFILNRIESTTGDHAGVGSAQLIVEAIVEDLKIKQKVLAEISKKAPPEAIIATNTSSLSITEIASGIERPERVIGMHFFNPVDKMPLLEIVLGKQTGDRAIAIVAALAVKLGKFPIVVRDVPGFLVNRILTPYLNEAAFLLEEGYSIADIDKAATSFGMPMGPVRLLDEVGLDVAAHVSEIMLKGYGERMKAPAYAAKLAGLGRKGKKSGSGFYNFPKGKSEADPAVYSLLGLASPHKDAGDRSAIRDRLVLALVNEAVRCLDEGVAGAPGPDAAAQVDLGTVMGMGFPPFRGGLLNYADSIGPRKIYQSLCELERVYGLRFKPTDGIRKRAERGDRFLA